MLCYLISLFYIYNTSLTYCSYNKEYTYLGSILGRNADGLFGLTQKNKFSVGDTIEVMKPDGANVPVRVAKIESEDGVSQDSAPHACQVIFVTLECIDPKIPDRVWESGDIIRADAKQ